MLSLKTSNVGRQPNRFSTLFIHQHTSL
ncbi:MAG: hypothetical protein ACI9C3_001178, partial [Yoonia sp.]